MPSLTRTHVATSLVLSWLVSIGLSYGNWTATGTFRYIDREFDETGFTGAEPPLPIRFANVEVRDPNAGGNKSLLATGATSRQRLEVGACGPNTRHVAERSMSV